MIHQLVDQGVLSAENKRDQGFGVKVKLQKRVELGKDLDAHQVGFIDDQDGSLFFRMDFEENASKGFGQKGDREGTGLDLKGEQDLFEEFEDGPGVGGNGNDSVFRGVKRRGSVAEGGGFTCPHLSGDDIQGAQIQSIAESVCEGLEARQRIEVLDLDILRERFSLKAEEVLIATHRPASFRRVFHPGRILQWEEVVQKSVAVRYR